ncbi:hypothetical protein PIB30_065185, partial [Stylosanthes scabra]|nr:hypothetical protein [Stylosanthes scabra]
DRIVGEVHIGKVVIKDCRRMRAGLSEFEEEVQDPLHFREGGGEGSVLGFCGTAAHRDLPRALPRYEVGSEEDAVPGRRSSVVRVAHPIRVCKNGKSQFFALIKC